MLPLTGAIKHYPWGSTDSIPRLLGREPDGTPWAEYWLGAHPDGAALIGDQRLDDLIARRPTVLGEPNRQAYGDQLPFMVKYLSAVAPLSIQAHPDRDQAEAGFARENAQGIQGTAERSFHDTWPKPELMVALGPFQALYGLRPAARTAELLARLDVPALQPVLTVLADSADDPDTMRSTFFAVLDTATPAMVSDLAAAAARLAPTDADADADADETRFVDTVRTLSRHFREDPSVLAALMLNRVILEPGQALFVPTGLLHAYLHGDGLEVMASSDNVLRAGLTPKKVDRLALREIGDFGPTEPAVLDPQPVAPGLLRYPTPTPEFSVWRIEGPRPAQQLPAVDRARVVVGVHGSLRIEGHDRHPLAAGNAYFVEAGEPLAVQGDGTAFLISNGL